MRKALITGLVALATYAGAQCIDGLDAEGKTGFYDGETLTLAEVTEVACDGNLEYHVSLDRDGLLAEASIFDENQNGYRIGEDDRFRLATSNGWVEYANGTARTSDGAEWEVSDRQMRDIFLWARQVSTYTFTDPLIRARRPDIPSLPEVHGVGERGSYPAMPR